VKGQEFWTNDEVEDWVYTSQCIMRSITVQMIMVCTVIVGTTDEILTTMNDCKTKIPLFKLMLDDAFTEGFVKEAIKSILKYGNDSAKTFWAEEENFEVCFKKLARLYGFEV
jgi:hypothetical protein